MKIVLMILLTAGVWMGTVTWLGDAGPFTRAVSILILLGLFSIGLGPMATESGFWARAHFVNVGTPGCIWYTVGLICLVVATLLVISGRDFEHERHTWNCRHLDNAEMKPVMRSVCAVHRYVCPEICTPLELMGDENEG